MQGRRERKKTMRHGDTLRRTTSTSTSTRRVRYLRKDIAPNRMFAIPYCVALRRNKKTPTKLTNLSVPQATLPLPDVFDGRYA